MLNRLPLRGLYIAACVGLIGTGVGLWAFRSRAQEPVTSKAVIDPAAGRLLDEVAQVYQGLNAYVDQGSFVFSLKVNGEVQEQKTDLSLAFERPNKLAMQSDGVRVASDGATLVTAKASVKKYMKQEAPAKITLATILTGPLGAMLAGSPVQVPALVVLGFLVDDQPVQRLVEGARTVSLEADQKIDGQTLKSVVIEQEQGPGLRLLIDPQTRLLRRIELIVAADQLQAKAPPKTTLSDLKISWSSGPIETEAPKPEAFTFNPPEGFDQVQAAEPAAGGGVKKNPLLGQSAPDFRFDVIEGDALKNVVKADLKGQVVLLDFWATWCPPCREELPEIRDLAARLAKGRAAGKVAVIAVSEDQGNDQAEVRGLVEKTLKELDVAGLLKGVVGRVALDLDGFAGNAFGVQGIPTLVLLDAQGVVQAVHVGYKPGIGEELEGDIAALLDGKSLVEPAKDQDEAKAAAKQP